jgi:hypothetical protein
VITSVEEKFGRIPILPDSSEVPEVPEVPEVSEVSEFSEVPEVSKTILKPLYAGEGCMYAGVCMQGRSAQ